MTSGSFAAEHRVTRSEWGPTPIEFERVPARLMTVTFAGYDIPCAQVPANAPPQWGRDPFTYMPGASYTELDTGIYRLSMPQAKVIVDAAPASDAGAPDVMLAR